mgnify:CR=1 FL=1
MYHTPAYPNEECTPNSDLAVLDAGLARAGHPLMVARKDRQLANKFASLSMLTCENATPEKKDTQLCFKKLKKSSDGRDNT